MLPVALTIPVVRRLPDCTLPDTVTLDSLVKEKKIPYPDFIKINVQGSELDVLQGGKRVLNNAKCLIVQTQDSSLNMNAPTTETVLDYLEKNEWTYIMKKFSTISKNGSFKITE